MVERSSSTARRLSSIVRSDASTARPMSAAVMPRKLLCQAEGSSGNQIFSMPSVSSRAPIAGILSR